MSWEAVDDRSAHATLQEGDISLTMPFTFDEEGLIEIVRAEARERAVGGEVIPTPWRGHFWNYEERGGMRVPMSGEGTWLLPKGEKPYWRGNITEISRVCAIVESPLLLTERKSRRADSNRWPAHYE